MGKNIIALILTNLLLTAYAFGQNGAIPNNRNMAAQSALDKSLTELVQQISDGLTENQKQRIAIVEFVDLKGNVSDFGRYLAEELITRLYQTKKFKVIERQLLNKIITEQKLSLTGIIEPTSAQKLGKLLGVDAICSGSISDLGKNFKVNARLINTETGEVFSVAATEIVKDDSVCALGGCAQSNDPQTSKIETKAGPWKTLSGFFTFEVKQCVRSGAAGYCDFTVMNSENDARMTVYGYFRSTPVERQFTRGFDALGNEISGAGLEFGNSGKQGFAFLNFVKEIPIKVRLHFDRLDASATKFTLLEIGFKAGEQYQSVKFRDVTFTVK